MRDVLESVGLDVWALVSATRVRRWMAGAGEMGVLFERELDRWGGGGSLEANLLCARERLLREVVYYVKRNEVAGDG